MFILTIKTDQPEAQLCVYKDTELLAEETWQAHRQLAETIHSKIEELLKMQTQNWDSLEGVICYEGPGSFTGLRIGLSVGNALAYGQKIPIVACGGKKWREEGIGRLLEGNVDKLALPEYGGEIHITAPRK